MFWDPAQYARFSDHRSRPFFDLTARVDCSSPRMVVDLGCGSGELTAELARRWSQAQVTGIDSSEQMVAKARSLESPPANLSFTAGDLRDWTPAPGTDVVVSNAALQWVPGHQALLTQWAGALEPGAWLAVQVPGNFGSPSHVLMRELAASRAWRDRLDGVLRHQDAVEEPDGYLRLMSGAGLTAEAWETTYQQVLSGPDPVLEWVRGTGLRPVLGALSPADAGEFQDQYGALLRGAYPEEPFGTVFAFRRVFAVGVKSSGG